MSHIKGRREPAYSIVTRLGGVSKTATICGVCPSVVSRWLVGKKQFGTSGLVPQRHWPRLMAHCKQFKIPISLSDLAGLNDNK